MITSVFRMLNVSQKDRKYAKIMEKLEYEKRGHHSESNNMNNEETRLKFYKKIHDMRIEMEDNNLGLFERINIPEIEARMNI